MRNKSFIAHAVLWLFATAALSTACLSCTEGYDLDAPFSPGVSDETLLSPPSDSIKCVLSATGEEVTVSWPVVMGAKGYSLSAFNTDDPSAPLALVQDKFIDGCSFTMPVSEDTHYRFEVKTLGNADFQNNDAQEASSKDFSTLVKTYMTIPSGTDLTAFFNDNPPSQADKKVDENGNIGELAYEMEAGGDYTISSPLDLSARKITLRGWKTNHAKVTFGPEGRIWTQNGLKLKFIDFDCSAFNAKDKNCCLYGLSNTPSDTITDHSNYKNFFIKEPIVLQSCNVRNLHNSLFFDNGKNYLLSNFVIKDVVCQIDQEQISLNFSKTSWLNMKISQSTFYGTGHKSTFFLSCNGERPVKLGTGSTKISAWSTTFENNTFYSLSYGQKRFITWNRYKGQAQHSFTVSKCIYVDCGVKGNPYGDTDNGNMTKIFSLNTYWFDGEKAVAQYDNADNLQTDPAFADPANGNFTVSGADQITARTGDPRWLPENTSQTDTPNQ